MNESRKNLIADLAADATAVRRPGRIGGAAVLWLGAALAYSVAILLATGPLRPDAVSNLGRYPFFAIETAVAAGSFNTLAAALTAAELIEPLKGEGPFTVFATTPGLGETEPFAIVSGTSQRFIADLADLKSSVAANSTGQCAHLFQRHREDQIPLWQNVELHPVYFDRESVEAVAEGTLRLQGAHSSEKEP